MQHDARAIDRPERGFDRLLAAKVAGQAGLVTRSQARAHGWSKGAIRWQIESGRWARVHRGVYLTTLAAMTGRCERWQRCWRSACPTRRSSDLSSWRKRRSCLGPPGGGLGRHPGPRARQPAWRAAPGSEGAPLTAVCRPCAPNGVAAPDDGRAHRLRPVDGPWTRSVHRADGQGLSAAPHDRRGTPTDARLWSSGQPRPRTTQGSAPHPQSTRSSAMSTMGELCVRPPTET